jgi:SAM-dependent methyltransferase
LVSDLYVTRFNAAAERAKDGVWRELGAWLQRYVDPGRPALDIGSDRGYFIRNVVAVERWATDVRDVAAAVGPEVRFTQVDGLELLSVLPSGHFGTVFMSNYLEHLQSREEVVDQLRIAHGLLRPGGRVVILQPNVRLVGGRYWDFIDHRVALTDASVVEAAAIAGFQHERTIIRFIPYSTKGRLPKSPLLVRLYLRIPVLWPLFGRQTLYVGLRT